MLTFNFFNKVDNTTLNRLLEDRTTGNNIIWATDSYSKQGESYAPTHEITSELITGENENVIIPRVLKPKEDKAKRTKAKAEVFTPSWVCNEMNNNCDEDWFGYKNVFNITKDKKWESTVKKIQFPDDKIWKEYILSTRLEITCGEAPFLVSRYDTTTGEFLNTKDRIGMFDRKMRIISENTDNEKDWLYWTYKALENIYGYEFQGDNLLLARINLLLSFVDYVKEALNRSPTEEEVLKAIDIITWNLWQMDGLYTVIPFSGDNSSNKKNKKTTIEPNGVKSKIKDWTTGKILEFYSIGK